MKRALSVFLLLASVGLLGCKGDASPSTPPAKAVLETSSSGEFRLSDKAIETIGLVMRPVSSTSETIPESAWVHSLDKVGVYRLRNGWFKFVSPSDLAPGDQIVVQGVALLRVAEMDAFGGEE